MEEYHEQCDEKNKVIIRDLAENSPSEDIKGIILQFDVDKNGDDIYKIMDKAYLKPAVVAAANYLHIDTTSHKYKDTLIRAIIQRLNSCLLEKCRKCSTYYSSDFDSEPIAVCDCGQPCHYPCYKDLASMFKEFPGVVFQCSQCTKTPHTSISYNKTANPKEIIEKSESAETKEKPDPERSPNDNSSSSDSSMKPTEKTFELKVVEAYNLDLLQARYPQASYQICEHYKRYKRPHGNDGKTEVEGVICKNLHPKRCYPWCQAGNNSKFGCNKGRECSFYHPRLCNNSLRYRKCTKPECTFTHLRFTRRYPRRDKENQDYRNVASQEPDVRNHNTATLNSHPPPWGNSPPQAPPPQAPPPQPPPPQAPPPQAPPPSNHYSNRDNDRAFLETLIRSLKEDMQREMQKEIRDFKNNISNHVAQLQPQLWHQNPPAVHQQLQQQQLQREQNAAPIQMQLRQISQPEEVTIPGIQNPQLINQHVIYRHQTHQ